tara:strand:+ start:1806 stop:2663 length:858 start_codon:yes stop_codon:yes gene_type:complete
MKHILVIPVYNDSRSLNKLISNLNIAFKKNKKIQHEILVIDDNSSEKIKINIKNFKTIKKLRILSLKDNLGSQKAIAVGLKYLKSKKKNFLITVMDGDGEDDPNQVLKMIDNANQNPKHIITSNRKRREESLIIVSLYKLHLIITFLFTWQWISFGNFSTFHKDNLKNLLSNNYSWYAHSSSVLKNCNIMRLYSKRKKRYFDKSKLGLISLIEHSLRVNVVFYKNIFLMSLVYLFSIFFLFENNIKILLSSGILFFNLLILIIKLKHWIKNISSISKFIKKIESV